MNFLGIEGILTSSKGGVSLPLPIEEINNKVRKKNSGFSDFGPSPEDI